MVTIPECFYLSIIFIPNQLFTLGTFHFNLIKVLLLFSFVNVFETIQRELFRSKYNTYSTQGVS